MFELTYINPDTFGLNFEPNPVATLDYVASVARWLQSKVEYIDHDTDCWVWAENPRKPGRAALCKEVFNTNVPYRISHILYHQFIVPTPECRHLCGNGRCVNPDHLWVGDKVDQRLDAEHHLLNKKLDQWSLAPRCWPAGEYRAVPSVAEVALDLIDPSYYDKLYDAIISWDK